MFVSLFIFALFSRKEIEKLATILYLVHKHLLKCLHILKPVYLSLEYQSVCKSAVVAHYVITPLYTVNASSNRIGCTHV